jgi:hypothetical protein
MLEITELRANFHFDRLELSQGSYTTGDPKSAGTHAGGGVFDVSVDGLSMADRKTVVRELRRTGFAAWHRTPEQDHSDDPWPYHIHAVAIGDRELSSEAKQQVAWYKDGYNGLWGKRDASGNPTPAARDDGPRDVEWTEYRQEIDLSYYGPQHWDDDDWTKFDQKAGWLKTITDGHGDHRDAQKILEFIHRNGFQAEESLQKIKTHLDITE